MLVASGATLAVGSSAALAACGTSEDDDEDVSPAREAELLNDVLAQQLAVLAAVRQAGRAAPEDAAGAIGALRGAREGSTDALSTAITELDGTPTSEPAAQAAQAESAVEGLARQLEASIAASLAAIGEVTPDRRQPVQRAIVEDATALAAMRATLGEEIAPDAFVMGPPAAEKAEA